MTRYHEAFQASELWTKDLSRELWDELFDTTKDTRYQYWVVP